ncbi:methyl-accepting chemotaxis protein [Paenibacillus eucommiae]|uniref:Methyl-accepting chemotaxis protein n=1 Tax=Paenibacillus eucommiae TaxID=1355755 RepID=A0ABS4IPA9_9BACL|nr:methyl-accepting chemotaxis protein [Paenibacillus eucommiae]MBP1989005.1 methyl-accepting chemotaxis protein [Paenibacillus eucommiae]
MSWFFNLKTSVKLICAFIFVSLILAAVGVYALFNMNTINGNMKEMYNNNLISVRDVSAAMINYQEMRVASRDISGAITKEAKDKVAAGIPVFKKGIEEKIASYRIVAKTKQEQDELEVFDNEWAAYVSIYNTAIELAHQTDQTDYIKYKEETLNVQGSKLRTSLERLIAINVQLATEGNEESQEAYSTARMATVIVIILSFIISILLGYAIASSISRPLNKLVGLVSKVSEGDLRDKSDIHTKDEIGILSGSVNQMIDNLRGLIGGIIQSSHSVASASEQISASSEEIASGNANQAQSAQTISELFTELSTAINFVANSAEQAAELSNYTVQTAGEGGKVVDKSIEGMQLVNQTMSRLEDDSNKIGDIIEVIDDIADQTNLLALNAAIEAARAGDQGRGFAVVADEVRKLAERSSAATKEISSIIKVMQQNTKLSVAAVLDSVTQSVETGDAFKKIVEMVSTSSNKVNEIAAACEEEAAQASEVMRSVELIAAASEEAAAASQETAATCQSLANLADDLNTSISVFKI